MTTNDKEFNSGDFRVPEFSIEVITSFGKFELEAYNVGKGFTIEHEMITPVLGVSSEQLPQMVELAKDRLENSLDTMT